MMSYSLLRLASVWYGKLLSLSVYILDLAIGFTQYDTSHTSISRTIHPPTPSQQWHMSQHMSFSLLSFYNLKSLLCYCDTIYPKYKVQNSHYNATRIMLNDSRPTNPSLYWHLRNIFLLSITYIISVNVGRGNPPQRSLSGNCRLHCISVARAVASLTVLGGQEFHFPHFFLNFSSNFTNFLRILISAIRVGESPTREGPGYATVHCWVVHRNVTLRGELFWV